MKIKVLTLTLVLIACGFAPASAATVSEKIVVNKKTALTFSLANSVTLNANGCEEVYIKYTIDKSYNFPNAYVMFGLYSAENNEAQSIYVQPGNGKGDQGPTSMITATRLKRQHFQKVSTHLRLDSQC
jgi:hypothetical protein